MSRSKVVEFKVDQRLFQWAYPRLLNLEPIKGSFNFLLNSENIHHLITNILLRNRKGCIIDNSLRDFQSSMDEAKAFHLIVSGGMF